MFVVFVSTFAPYQFAFLIIYLAQLITAVRTQTMAWNSALGPADRAEKRNLANYQLSLLLFWTSCLPFCAPELLVWIRNLSVLWFEDAPADHNLVNMGGYFALRILASHRIVPSLSNRSQNAPRRLRIATYAIFGAAIGYAMLFSARRPHILYSVANAISAWLAALQIADFPLKLLAKPTPAHSPLINDTRSSAPSSSDSIEVAAGSSSGALDRKLR
ncbi:GPI inositol deacylase [Coemansia sp. RSA 552]|nr:GPI inositol deacylase [Coemansia sp. RSA 552]